MRAFSSDISASSEEDNIQASSSLLSSSTMGVSSASANKTKSPKHIDKISTANADAITNADAATTVSAVAVVGREDVLLKQLVTKGSQRGRNFTTKLEIEEEKIIVASLEKDTLEDITANNAEQDLQRDQLAIEHYQQLFAEKEKLKESPLNVVCSNCSALIAVPRYIVIDPKGFQCGACGVVLHIPTDTEVSLTRSPDLVNKAALIRWLVRAVVYQEVNKYLSSKPQKPPSKAISGTTSFSSSLIEALKLKIIDFPMFRDEKYHIAEAVGDVFELLPTINQQMIKTNKRGLNRRLVNIIAGPIYTTAIDQEFTKAGIRTHVVNQFHHLPMSKGLAYEELKESLSTFFSSLIGTNDGLEDLLEAIKSSNSIAELPKTVQDLFEKQKIYAVYDLLNSMAKPGQKSKLKSLYKIFPRRTFIKILKWNLGGKAIAGAGFKILVAKPFGSHSLLQRMTAEVIGVKNAQSQLAEAITHLSPSIQNKLIKFAELYCNDEHDIEVEALSEQDIINALNTPTGEDSIITQAELNEFKKSEESTTAARNFLINHVFLRDAMLLVDLCGDDRITTLFARLIPAVQAQIMSAATAKSTGLVELFETLFQGWRRIIKADVNKGLSKPQIEAIYTDVVTRVQDDLFTLVHNLLRNDQPNILHESLIWFIDTWKEASFDLGIDELLQSLPKHLYDAVMKDAEKARIRYEENQNRPPGTSKLPEVELSDASHLVNPLSQIILSRAFASVKPSSKAQQALKAKRSSLTKGSASLSLHSVNRNMIITNIEIIYDYEDSSSLTTRGYEQLPHSMNHGSTGYGCYLWYRKTPISQVIERHRDTSQSKRVDISPISSIAITGTGEDERVTIEKSFPKDKKWVMIPREINKGSGTRTFLVYQRSSTNEALIDLQMAYEGDKDIMQNLTAKGYKIVSGGPCNVGRFFLTSRLFILALYAPINITN